MRNKFKKINDFINNRKRQSGYSHHSHNIFIILRLFDNIINLLTVPINHCTSSYFDSLANVHEQSSNLERIHKCNHNYILSIQTIKTKLHNVQIKYIVV